MVVGLCILTIAARAQTIPKILWDTWKIERYLPTRTISCWGESDARKVTGTDIEYSANVFRWQAISVKNPSVENRVVTAEQFAAENSAMDAEGSQVNFRELRIKAKSAEQISIPHPPARVTGQTGEIPGDKVWVKNPKTIVFSLCNLYFEAKRVQENYKR